MQLSQEQYNFLISPVHPSRVKQLKGSAHLEAWDVRRHLTRVFGFGGWDVETLELALVAQVEHPPAKPGERPRWTVVYRAQVRLVVKAGDGTPLAHFEDAAVGDAANQPVLGDAHDLAAKAALSGALKRAAVNLGDGFGLSLYNDGSTEATIGRTLVVPVNISSEAPQAEATDG